MQQQTTILNVIARDHMNDLKREAEQARQAKARRHSTRSTYRSR